MTREEAIKSLQEDGVDLGAGDFVDVEALKMGIAALREQEEYEGLKNSYDQLQASFDIIFESNQKMGEAFRLLLNEQEERSKGCILCSPEPRCGTCGKFFDYYDDGGSDRCSATVWEERCAYYKSMPFCPRCGRKLEVEG